ncbi:hypothetical protein P153DRAFT_89471 [Dothidotthia symphoricarpi CBS 119687]|uniref:Transmembrane protein n=1 Tax=Dothidotthia symphoricarpi CBS 119687 TaxID=1392245 RepID=A0A6A6A688_9PLEO|nr:uncharacterized protein P153DRAFT_89471 [Dothidotthia symphoricarpi CBS 119687]KAF2126278.1 hypothetical protein P153DRAFT_89471 [Dothidotthia symphoricarpi CBS 119687]
MYRFIALFTRDVTALFSSSSLSPRHGGRALSPRFSFFLPKVFEHGSVVLVFVSVRIWVWFWVGVVVYHGMAWHVTRFGSLVGCVGDACMCVRGVCNVN